MILLGRIGSFHACRLNFLLLQILVVIAFEALQTASFNL
jgi:hypothetical protein